MVKHCIILSSSYSSGCRIALHFIGDDPSYEKAIEAVKGAYDGKRVSFGVHILQTEDPSWDSVVKSDPYFDDVKVIGSIDEFVELIRKDRYLKGSEIARYILSKTPCTHTHLQKLTYMCYADYLCETGERLFEDRILAFKFGPVIDTVYQRYKANSHESPGEIIIDNVKEMQGEETLPIMSRLFFAEDGIKKVASIDRTLKKYGSIPTDELVELTHLKDTPWYATDKSGPYAEISDADIMRLHANESPGGTYKGPRTIRYP